MIIALIKEPRSGSNSLARWLANKTGEYEYSKYFTLNRGWNRVSLAEDHFKDYSNLQYTTKYLIQTGDYYPGNNYEQLINKSDKVIFLYRKNEKEQIESWVAGKRTGRWVMDFPYQYEEIDDEFGRQQTEWFKQLKKEYFEKYLSNPNNFRISYEELYFENQIQKVIDYLNLPELKDGKGFPYGKKYRRFNNELSKPSHLL